MKVKEISLSEKSCEENDYRDAFEIEVDGVSLFSFYDGEPEDSNMGRNFSDVRSIVGAMRLAHKAGKDGQEFEVESIEVDEI
jgi:hypothetical protein